MLTVRNVVVNRNGKHLFLDINALGSDIFAVKLDVPVELDNRISFSDSCRVAITVGGVIIDNIPNGQSIKDIYESFMGRRIIFNDPVKSAVINVYVYRIRTSSMPIGVGNIHFIDVANGRKCIFSGYGNYSCTVRDCGKLIDMVTVNGGILSAKQLNVEIRRTVLFGVVESVLAEYLETVSYADLLRSNYKVVERVMEEFVKKNTGFVLNSFAFEDMNAEESD